MREGGVDAREASLSAEEFQDIVKICRTHLLPGLLKSLQSNRSTAFKDGVKLFEVSDVVLLDRASDVGRLNDRMLGLLRRSAEDRLPMRPPCRT